MNYKLIHDPELNEIRLLIGVPPFTPEEHKVEVEMLRRLRDDLTRILDAVDVLQSYKEE